nr:RNA-directed DNA polymerase, eukaryota, reverse transcriptase zinc-binding domain protein [Tanacetum cinerariifolium]
MSELPTRLNLDYKGAALDSVRCPICDNDIENEEHLCAHSDIFINTWSRVLQWWLGDPKYWNSSTFKVINLPRRVNIATHNFCYFDIVVRTTIRAMGTITPLAPALWYRHFKKSNGVGCQVNTTT